MWCGVCVGVCWFSAEEEVYLYINTMRTHDTYLRGYGTFEISFVVCPYYFRLCRPTKLICTVGHVRC